MSENNEFGAFLSGFLIGGLVGAAAALILAPQAGETTRTQITSKREELWQVSSERVQSAREQAGSYVAQYRSVAPDMPNVEEATAVAEPPPRIILDKGTAKDAPDENPAEPPSTPDEASEDDQTPTA